MTIGIINPEGDTPISDACDYCGLVGEHGKGCPNIPGEALTDANEPHVFDGNPRDKNAFCSCGYRKRDANHVKAPRTVAKAAADEPIVDAENVGDVGDVDDGAFDVTIVDGKEARIINELPLPLPSPDVKRAIERLEKANARLMAASERAKEAAAEKKEEQEAVNVAVIGVIDAMHAYDAPSLFS